MESSTAALEITEKEDAVALPVRPAAVLKGTARGLEVIVDAGSHVEAIAAAITKRMEEAPGFFKGSDVRVRVEGGALPPGSLARLDELAVAYELRIVEVTAAKRRAETVEEPVEAIPEHLAAGSAPTGIELELAGDAAPLTIADLQVTDLGASASFEEPTQTAAPVMLAATVEAELETEGTGPRIVIGPVRSGVILEHHGHLIIFGDVNPGAEVRAAGNIVVLGRLRGTAHAGIGQDVGFILALRLQPQQLRIGRKVSRAADADDAATDAEIAYAADDRIVVERYLGKLPRNLATSI